MDKDEMNKISAHGYSADPYIRNLALKTMGCLGAFSEAHSVCSSCPFQRECKTAREMTYAAIGAELDNFEQQRILAENKKIQASSKKNESISELMSKMSEKTTAIGTDNLPSVPSRFKPLPTHVIEDSIARRRSVCAHCQKLIPLDDDAKWIEDIGVFHLDCIEA